MIGSDIRHKYHLWYFKIVSNFTRLTARIFGVKVKVKSERAKFQNCYA